MKKQITCFLALICGLQVFAQTDTLQFEGETHFKNVQQLTFGGDNAEAYWSYDGKRIIFQKTNPKDGIVCDQIFMGALPLNAAATFTYKLVSTGMPLRMRVILPVRHQWIALNMVINIFGLCTTAMIFLWQIQQERW